MRHFACAAILVLLPSLALAQEKTVPTPANVKVEGMPPIPQSILDGMARYAQFRQALMQAWHPTKREMLITTTLGPQPQIYLVEGPRRDRSQLTWLPNGVSSLNASPSFDPADPNTVVFQYDPGGGEGRSLYRYDMTTGDTTLATSSKTRYVHVWSRQGKWIAFDSSERNGKDRDLYVMQPSDPKSKRLVAQVEGAFGAQDWSPDGSTLLVTEFFGNSETYIWRVDVKTGVKTALTPRDGEKVGWFNARFSADGKRVYAISDRDGDWRIWRCEVAACKWTAVTPPGVFVDPPGAGAGASFELSPDGAMIAAVIDHGSTTELQVFDAGTFKPRPLPAMPKGQVTQLHWRPGSREIGFTFGSVDAQGDAYSIDASLGTLTRWTASEKGFNPALLPPPEVIEWKSFDGTTISGILYRAAAKFTGPRPVLVSLHGGPDGRERALFRGRSNYFLNELGVAIIYPNVRGSLGFGHKFEQMDNGKLRDGAIKDVGALLDWVAGRPEFDKDRVVLIGNSYGGWLALESAIVYNSRIRGVIEGAGMTNFVTFLEQTDGPRQENRRQEYGDERDPQMREYLLSLSPVTRAAELKKPVLMIQAGKDPRVPVTQGQELLKAMKGSTPNVWYVEFTEANHDNLAGVGDTYLLLTWMWFFKTFVLN